MIEILFEWDPRKAAVNKQKHGMSFELSSMVFKDCNAITIYDDEHSDTEDRWVTIGLIDGITCVVVHHTVRDTEGRTVIRIISSRRATVFEEKQYWEGIE